VDKDRHGPLSPLIEGDGGCWSPLVEGGSGCWLPFIEGAVGCLGPFVNGGGDHLWMVMAAGHCLSLMMVVGPHGW